MPRQPTGRPPGRPVGSGAVLEREQTRLTVRIPATLYDRLEAFAEGLHFTRGTPQLSGCVREALEHFLVCPQMWQTQNVHTDHSANNRQTTTIHTAAMDNNRQTENGTETVVPMSTDTEDTIRQTDNSTDTVVPILVLAGDNNRQTTNCTEAQASIPAEEPEENGQTQNSTASQPETAEPYSDDTRQTESVPTAVPAYDHTRYQLGALCKRGHAYGDTGQSLRELRQGKVADCAECHRERARTSQGRRLAKSGGKQ